MNSHNTDLSSLAKQIHAVLPRQRFARLCILFIVLFFGSFVFAAEQMFDMKEVTDGVYIALAHPAPVINCNSAVIILDDGVLVVDTQSKPSAARAVIEQIKTVTNKPIRYVVNTHYHYDHFQGNSAYVRACPGVEIISSANTRRGILRRGIPRIKAEIAGLTKRIDSLKRESFRATEAAPIHYQLDKHNMVAAAVENRMEMLELELQLTQDASTVDYLRNQALPLVTLDYTYNVSGLGATRSDSFDLLCGKS